MDDDNAFISSSLSDDALLVGSGIAVLLLLLPTIIWLTVTLLRGRE
ncbi:hypothetical protein [Nonomuraea wenchangensis]|nr:hypothetical protein [Nonomuraea wenchangensis]